MAQSSRIIELSAAHVSTTYAPIVNEIGMRGMAFLNATDKKGLKLYRSLSDVQDDFDIDTPIWNQANAYFTGSPDGAFYLISYDASDKGTQATPKLDGVTTNSNSASIALSDGTATDNGLFKALENYYYSGATYIVFPVNSAADQATAITLSNFVEAQDRGLLVIEYATPANTDVDATTFAWLDTIARNRSTKVLSTDLASDPNNTIGADFLGNYVAYNLGANAKFTTGLSITPKTQDTFTPTQLAFYEAHNIGTYVVENGLPIITNGRTMSGMSFASIVIKNAMTSEIVNSVATFLQPHGVNNRVAYDATDFKAIKGLIMGVLDSYKSASLIGTWTINDPQYSDLTEEQKDTGVISAFNWKFFTMPTIDQGEFAQTLVVTDGQ